MIVEIGIALSKIFENININNTSVQFHFGDQKEFNKWQLERMRYQKQKYPLIWLSPQGDYERLKNGNIMVDSELLLFMGTKENYNNTERYHHNYLTYLTPLAKLIEQTLQRNQYITLLQSPLQWYDEPNFGSNNDAEFDSTSSRKKEPKSITIDIVDARILKFKININHNCIIS